MIVLLTDKLLSMYVLPDTKSTFDPNSSTYRFEPTSSVCVGDVFNIPTFDSVNTRPYTWTSRDSDVFGTIWALEALLSVYPNTNSSTLSLYPMATFEPS